MSDKVGSTIRVDTEVGQSKISKVTSVNGTSSLLLRTLQKCSNEKCIHLEKDLIKTSKENDHLRMKLRSRTDLIDEAGSLSKKIREHCKQICDKREAEFSKLKTDYVLLKMDRDNSMKMRNNYLSLHLNLMILKLQRQHWMLFLKI